MCTDTLRKSETVCQYEGCTKTVWQDPDGSYSAFCSAAHRDGIVQSIEASYICKGCGIRPVYIEDRRPHEFCGIRCASAFRTGQRKAQKKPEVPQDAMMTCKLPDCDRLCFVGPNRVMGEYCSKPHQREAVTRGTAEACLLCNEYPKTVANNKPSDFCSKKCAELTQTAAPIILDVSPTSDMFERVATRFKQSWRHPSTVPDVVKVWKIYCSAHHNTQFARYKLYVERRTGLLGGNTRPRWHGTRRVCALAEDATKRELCEHPQCSLCSIIRSSFERMKAGERTNYGRFGAGIYTSATSSKAHDYVWVSPDSKYKVMLLNDVVMGTVIKLQTEDISLVEPPEGYDAVIGEPGKDLNYDECIVYRNEAIRPLFLVTYKSNSAAA